MTLTILWSTYRKHRHFHDETNKINVFQLLKTRSWKVTS